MTGLAWLRRNIVLFCVAASVGLGGLAVFAFASEPAGSVDLETAGGAAPPDWMSAEEMPLANPEAQEQLRESFLVQQQALEQRRSWLMSPAVASLREESKLSHRDLSNGAALELFTGLWSSYLTPPLPDAETLVGDDTLSAFVDDQTMRVLGEDGRRDRLVLSDLPLRSVDRTGELARTDVDLVRRGDEFVPENSPAQIQIPVSLDDGAEIDELTVIPEGDAVGVKLDGDTIGYPNADIDTDIAMVSTLTGIETFHQLRSDRSPESLKLTLEVPAGGVLEQVGSGGVRVVRDSHLIASISPPIAVDAQGEPVAASLRIDGADVMVDVPHRDKDVAYPVLVDPFVEEDWARNGTINTTGTWFHQNPTAIAGLSMWSNSHTPNVADNVYAPRLQCFTPVAYTCYSPAHNGSAWDGLHMLVRASTTYPAGSYGQWYYTAPGYSTRINRVDWGAMHLRPGGTAANPFFYYGIISHPLGGFAQVRTFSNSTAGGAVNNITHDWYAQFAGGVAGPQSLVAGWQSNATTSVPYWRDGYIGGMIVQLTDPDQPTNLTVDRTGPTGWTASGSFTAAPEARDAGVGMKSFVLRVPGSTGVQVQARSHPCTGRKGSECPSYDYRSPPAAASRSWELPDPTIAGIDGTSFSYSATDANPGLAGNQQMPEGINTVSLEARDIIHGSDAPTVATWQTRVDRSAPELIVAGGLRVAEGQDVYSDAYDLAIRAIDGDGSTNSSARSGVKSIEVKVDGVRKSFVEQACADGSCLLEENWEFVLADYSSGDHTITVIATDQLGNAVTDSWQVDVTDPDVACVPPDYAPHYLEGEFEGLGLTDAQQQCRPGDPMAPRDDYVSYSYGECETPPLDPSDPEAEIGACLAPLEVQAAPICERHAELYQQLQEAVVPSPATQNVPGLVLPPVGEDEPLAEEPPTEGDPETGNLDPYVSLEIRGAPAALFGDGTIEIYTEETTVSIMGADPAQVLRAANAIAPAPGSVVPEQDEPITEPPPELGPSSPPPLPDPMVPAAQVDLEETVPCR